MKFISVAVFSLFALVSGQVKFSTYILLPQPVAKDR